MGRQQTHGHCRWGQLTIAIVCQLALVTSQGLSTWDPLRTTCNINSGRAVVVGNKMYVDGGEIVDQSGYGDGIDKPYPMADLTPWQNPSLWELDLSQKFNVSIPSWTTHAKPGDWNEHYDGSSGTLWDLGDGRFYTLGGYLSIMEGPAPGQRIRAPYYTQNASGYYFQLPQSRIFSYDSQTENWSSQLLPTDIHRVFNLANTQSVRNKVGYTLGGVLLKDRDSSMSDFTVNPNLGAWLDSMSAYDFRTGKFNFTTLPVDIGPTSQVIMHCLDRVGKEGILVAFAGISNNNNVLQARPMDEILVYNIENSIWTKQRATGDIPPHRSRACSMLVPAPDLSSFQIYLFSGIMQGDTRLLDMYVLSIPTFTWTRIAMKNYPNEWTMADMVCGLYEERQLIIVPGTVNVTTAATAADNWWMQCNKGIAVHVFDTYDWEFKPEFDPDNKGSKVPPTISKLVGGSDTGGATLKQPKAGWDDAALGTIFSIRNELPPEEKLQFPPTNPNLNSTSPTTSAPQTDPSDETPQGTKPNKNVIIGGVVGGVCGVALTAGILIFFLKRSRKPSQPESELGPDSDRVELNGTNYNYHGFYELPATETAQEMGCEKDAGFPKHPPTPPLSAPPPAQAR